MRLISILTTVLLVACGGGGSSAPEENSTPTPAPTTQNCNVFVTKGPYPQTWPTLEWSTASLESQGMCPDEVQSVIDYAFLEGNDTGAIIVIEQSNSLEFIKSTGDETRIEITPQIIESIFHKNGPLHDGAIIIKGNTITATRIILPVSDSNSIPKRYGLRHKAGIGISEKTDALVIVVSEQRGDVTYIKDGNLERISSSKKLHEILTNDLSS